MTLRLDNAYRYIAALRIANSEKSRLRIRHGWWRSEEIGMRAGLAGAELDWAVADAVWIGWIRHRDDGWVMITFEGREVISLWATK